MGIAVLLIGSEALRQRLGIAQLLVPPALIAQL